MTISHVPTTVVLQELLDHAPSDQFTIRWLLERLNRHAFGIAILLLAFVGMVPGICVLAAILLFIPASEMIAGRTVPTFPKRLADRLLPTQYLVSAVRRANPVLLHVEMAIHPRWRIRTEIIRSSRNLLGHQSQPGNSNKEKSWQVAPRVPSVDILASWLLPPVL